MWVGSRVTPNKTDATADWLKQQRGGKGDPSRALGSPHQLTACPWCGSGLEPGRDITVDLVGRRTLVRCPDWRGETRALFGRVRRRCARHGYVTSDLLGAPWELSSDTSLHPAKDGYPMARMEHVAELRPPN